MKPFTFAAVLCTSFWLSLYCGGQPEIVREPLPVRDASCCEQPTDGGAESGGSAQAPAPDQLVTTPAFGSMLVVLNIDGQEYAMVCGGDVSFIPVESVGRQLLKLKRTP